jgi:hypothetical protein
MNSSIFFGNFIGRGLKKFANIFMKSSVSSMEINKDPNLLNNMNTNKSEDSLLKKNFGTNNAANDKFLLDNKTLYWDEPERKKENRELQLNEEFYSNSFSQELQFKKLFNSIQRNEVSVSNKDELVKNSIKNRVCEATINANHPREDRSNAVQLKNFDGYFLSVLDGHGGDEVAEFASSKLHKKFDIIYQELKSEDMNEDEKVKFAINNTFEQIVI